MLVVMASLACGVVLVHLQSLRATQAAKHYGISAQFASPVQMDEDDDFVVQ
jgi:hypothetical protein